MSQEKIENVDSNWDRIHKTHYVVTSSYSAGIDPRFKLTASWSNGSRIRMIPGEVFETNDGTYKITYQNGPLSCSVAGGMTLLTTFPDGTSENVFFPPGYSCEKIEGLPAKQQSQYISSGVNSELWKEALEDAKKVRKEALENAKEALEEAFANHPKRNTVKQKCSDEIIGSPTDIAAYENYVKTLGRHTAEEEWDRQRKKKNDTSIENFKVKIKNYPKHLSYEGSVVLCVMLSMKEVAYPHLSNLPSSDQVLIRSLIPKNISVNLDTFEVKFDESKDFILTFSTPPIYDEDVVLTMFNSVAHPRPEDLKGAGVVPVEKDGDKIEVGGKIVLNRKGIERLIGLDNKPKHDTEEETLPRRQPVAGRNAFEIRSDIMQMALDYATHRKNNVELTPDEIVGVAKKFYAFVENKR